MSGSCGEKKMLIEKVFICIGRENHDDGLDEEAKLGMVPDELLGVFLGAMINIEVREIR